MTAAEIKERPFAGCPDCGAPLVSTFEVPKKEWICVPCDKFFEWLSARPAPGTAEENQAKYDQHAATYKAARAERQAAQS